MNESRRHLNENDPNDKTTKKCLKKMKVTIYTDRLIIETS